MPRSFARLAPAALCTALVLVVATASRADTARTLFLTGRYADAQAAYARDAARDRLGAAIGIARCREAVGDVDGALAALTVPARDSGAATLCAERARLQFGRGRYAAAQAQVDSALRLVPDQPGARYLSAELHRVAGRLEQANDGYRWFVRFYNREQDRITDPDVLRWVGLAGAQYARWNHVSAQFHFLVNTLYPDAIKRDSLYWPAHLDAALLFIEKYNRADATAEIDAGLAINPRAAALHAARALVAFQEFDLDSTTAAIRRALAIDPRLPEAHRLASDVALVVSGPAAALAALEPVRAWNPADDATLGRMAAACGAIDGMGAELSGTRMGRLVDEAVARNPHCGEFFAALAAALDLRYDYPNAARFYEEARRRMPQLITVPGQLGLVALRLGDETRARTALTEAFELDPFNVRVKNSLDVLDVLAGYATRETPHFILRYDAAHDSLLANAACRWLEDDVYPQVVKSLRFEPPHKTLIEIFSAAKGSSGHTWFSIRMAGLPFVGTIGASSGGMIALTSPDDTATPFNWARVLKHEFVHVVNLQQTGFAIPRWFTEGLAVRHEGPGTPAAWDRVLGRRLDADQLFDLGTLNMGFMRPRTSDDWALAYAQAELYTRYIATTCGDDALQHMIEAYAGRRDTRAALQRCCGVAQDAFETGYRRYVAGLVHAESAADRAARRPAPPTASDVPELERAATRHPRDAAILGRLAYARLAASRPYEARSTALQALAIDPRQPQAAIVKARVDLRGGDEPAALAVLRDALDRDEPDPELLALLADRLLQARQYAAAESLLDLGAGRFPNAANWEAGRLAIYKATDRADSLAAALTRVVARDANEFDGRMELARAAVTAGDWAAAERWAGEALQIRIRSPEAHATLAAALAGRKRAADAAREYGVALALAPERSEWRRELAKAYVAAGARDRARATLDELLAREPNDADARAQRDALGR